MKSESIGEQVNEVQFYNTRNKRWTLYRAGKIVDVQKFQFENVPVSDGQSQQRAMDDLPDDSNDNGYCSWLDF